MNYYTYKVTFKDLPGYFYYGRHKCKGRPYFGSPVTWSFLWLCFEPEIQILQWYETLEEVVKAEESIIRATWGSKYSLNEHIGGHFSEETCRKNGKRTLSNMPREVLSRNGRINVSKIPRETLVANGEMRTSAQQEARRGNLANAPEEAINKNRGTNGKMKTPLQQEARRKLISKMPRATLVENAESTNAQKWMCTKTGYVSNSGGLTSYQKARGIETTDRVRIE